MPKYNYLVTGKAQPDGQTWSCAGVIETQNEGDFASVPERVLRHTFHMLTDGAAVYGKPGVGCQGPYKIDSMLIDKMEDVEHGSHEVA